MRPRLAVLALVALTVVACGGGGRTSNAVQLDPVVNLTQHGRVGLVTFTAQNARGGLVTLATQKFEEQLLSAQPGVEILELGSITGPVAVSPPMSH